MILIVTIQPTARFNLDLLNKKANAVQDEIKQKMKVFYLAFVLNVHIPFLFFWVTTIVTKKVSID